MVFQSEREADACILLMHLRAMARRLRELPADKWDWTVAPAAPTARTLAVHTFQWLQCDRQHIGLADATLHRPVPIAPTEPSAICDALEAETNEWETLLKNLSEEDLNRPSLQFAQPNADMNGRGFIAHMIQNVIYKHGQFAYIYFALGLDGEGEYEAPFPNPNYKELLGIE